MKYCVSCGNPVDDSAKFCTVCGAEIKPTDEAPKGFTAENTGGEARESKVDEAINRLTNTADTTSDYAVDDINNNRLMAILAYIGILVLVPLFLNTMYKKIWSEAEKTHKDGALKTGLALSKTLMAVGIDARRSARFQKP